ncbi:MAG: putative DNA methylase [Ignavibacteria bacterium]|nr:MAG: putative DNA methylase [Ignavibacteria bacterium]KAF0161725.1 MAG: putative DNA methylase [Ignavibacteria bacterium]
MSKKSVYVDLGDRGRYNTNNKMNDLTGKEWLKFTKSWFIHRPIRRKENEILHPAKFPESLVEEFIVFFTKENAWVLDPFCGTGSVLIASASINRKAVGIELNDKYHNLTQKRISNLGNTKDIYPILGNSLELKNSLQSEELSSVKFDFVITSPPYWNQLMRSSIRQSERKQKGLDTRYSSENNLDLGNLESYDEFIEMQALVFDQVYDVTKTNSYLTIITNNVYADGKLYPLAFDTASSLTKRGEKSWVLKDEKIWLQDDKKLIALGVNNAWIGNRHHQYCLIFRKEK